MSRTGISALAELLVLIMSVRVICCTFVLPFDVITNKLAGSLFHKLGKMQRTVKTLRGNLKNVKKFLNVFIVNCEQWRC